MKELGRLLNRKTILLILAAACICVVAVFAGDFSDCGIDNYKIKVREYNWLINGHTDEQIQQHADELAQDDRRIFKRLAKEYKEKSDYIDGYTESVKAVITNASNMKKFSVFGTSESIANINKTENVVKTVLYYLAGYVVILIVSVLLISLDNFDMTTNFTAVMATFNNVGPGLNRVGPTGNFGGFSVLSKLVLMFDMLVGRLELYPMLVIFAPGLWRIHPHRHVGKVQ